MLNMLIGGIGLISVVAAVYFVFRALARWYYGTTEMDPMADIQTCPYCLGDVPKDALVCPHCKSNLD